MIYQLNPYTIEVAGRRFISQIIIHLRLLADDLSLKSLNNWADGQTIY